MRNSLQLDEWTIEHLDCDNEINFVVYDQSGYCFRLVPGTGGFELSKLDLCLGTTVEDETIYKISDFILSNDE